VTIVEIDRGRVAPRFVHRHYRSMRAVISRQRDCGCCILATACMIIAGKAMTKHCPSVVPRAAWRDRRGASPASTRGLPTCH
jgi:hypothetical protein